MLINKVRSFILEHNLINKGDQVIVGVSGGPDSVALLHVLYRLSGEQGFTLHIAHLNHGLRSEAGEEEAFVAGLASALGLPFTSTKADVRQIAVNQKLSLEEAGREARYAFFHRLQQELGATRVATAHHMGDQAETVLMHLLRGSGLKGLRGIMPARGIFIRPLLTCTKGEILAYLKKHQTEYCIDRSNYNPIYLRNRIRHQLLPLLEREYNPDIIGSLAQMAAIIRDENRVLEELTVQVWEKAATVDADGHFALDLEELHALPAGLQRRLVLHALAKLRGGSGWEMKDVEQVIALSRKEGSSKEIRLSKGVRVQKSYGEIIFRTGEKKPRPFRYFLQIPGNNYINEMQAEIICSLHDKRPEPNGPNRVVLDWDRLKKPLEIRSRRPGDRFRPFGLQGSKKLQDFFTDIKLPAGERDRVGILASGDDIYWIIGYRLDERALVDDNTRKFLVLDVKTSLVN